MNERVLVVKNAKNEGPGTLLEFLKERNMGCVQIEAYSNNWDIKALYSCDYLIVLGGPMAVYEMDKYKYLAKVASAMEVALRNGKKILGICLGAQLLAHVLGAKVYYSGKEEIGWCEIEVTEEGLADPCFGAFTGVKRRLEVFQWHRDTFELPRGAKRLAFSYDFPNQAFSYNGSYGLQFHPEVTPSMIGEWFENTQDFSPIFRKTESVYPSYRKAALEFFERFFIGT